MLSTWGSREALTARKLAHFRNPEFRRVTDAQRDRLRDAGYGGMNGLTMTVEEANLERIIMWMACRRKHGPDQECELAVCLGWPLPDDTNVPADDNDLLKKYHMPHVLCKAGEGLRSPFTGAYCSGASMGLGLPAHAIQTVKGRHTAPLVLVTEEEAVDLLRRGRCLHGEDVTCKLVICKGAGHVDEHLYCLTNKAIKTYSRASRSCVECARIGRHGEKVAVLVKIANTMSGSQKTRGHRELPVWKALDLLAEEIRSHGLWSKYTGKELRLEINTTFDSLSPDRHNEFDPCGYYDGNFGFCELSLNNAASFRDAKQLVELADLHDKSVAFLSRVCPDKKPEEGWLY